MAKRWTAGIHQQINVISISIEDLSIMIYTYEMPDDHVLLFCWEQISSEDVVETCSLVTASVQFQ